MPIDYTAFLSDYSKTWVPNPIRGLFHLEKQPGVISLLAGKPNPSTFPITSISFRARNPLHPDGAEEEHILSADQLALALQYTDTAGIAPLNAWLTDFQAKEHEREQDPKAWKLSVAAGSQDVIYKTFMALLNPGDFVIVEAPVYASAVPILNSLHAIPVEVETDADGVDPASLRAILEAWPSDKPRPRLMYTVPFGNNPSGSTTTEDRRREVLALASEFNFLLLEDDPYYFLYFDQKARPASHFRLDTEGRVIRADSFSKVFAPGLRLGFVTGPPAIIDALNLHTANANLQPSSSSQAIAYKLLSSWGRDGFAAHIRTITDFYRTKRDVFQASMERHLNGLARWSPPRAGMFFWFELLLPPGSDSKELIEKKAFEAGVLALPGGVFFAGGRRSSFVRASYSLLEENQVDEALKRLAGVVRKEWPEGQAPA